MRSPPSRLTTHADSSVPDNKESRCLMYRSGVVFTGGQSHGSAEPNIVTLSATDSEYIAVAHVIREVALQRNLLEFLQTDRQRGHVTVKDNDGAVQLASDPICISRTKHVDIHGHCP